MPRAVAARTRVLRYFDVFSRSFVYAPARSWCRYSVRAGRDMPSDRVAKSRRYEIERGKRRTTARLVWLRKISSSASSVALRAKLLEQILVALSSKHAQRFCHQSEVFSRFLARYAWWQGVRIRYPRPRYPVTSVHGGGGPWNFKGVSGVSFSSSVRDSLRRFRMMLQESAFTRIPCDTIVEE